MQQFCLGLVCASFIGGCVLELVDGTLCRSDFAALLLVLASGSCWPNSLLAYVGFRVLSSLAGWDRRNSIFIVIVNLLAD